MPVLTGTRTAPRRAAPYSRATSSGAGELDQDAVAVADALGLEPRVGGVAPGGELPVGPSPGGVGHGRRVGVLGGGLVEQVVYPGVGAGLRCGLTVHCDSCRPWVLVPAPAGCCRRAAAREVSFLRSVLRLGLSGNASRWW